MTGTNLSRHYVEKPWGRTDLPEQFAAGERRIGEVWYDLPSAKLPLLVKWLFTSEKLSIQVHPNDEQARDRGLMSGKEECWIVTAADEGARIGMGTLETLSGEQLRKASLSGDIERLMDWKPVKAGDWFYIPAGTVHAIGAGITLVEIQQNADITYRLYDYGRPRELHLEDGVAVSMAAPYGDPRHGRLSEDHRLVRLVDGPYFRLWQARGDALMASAEGCEGPQWIVPLSSQVSCAGQSATVGDVLYVAKTADISADPSALYLIASLPD